MNPEEADTPGREPWRPERETKSQRAWRPGQQKKQRSIQVLFTSTVLICEAFVIAFFGLMLFGLNQDDGGLWMLIGALVLALLTGATARFVAKPIGLTIGWIIQVLLIASGFLEPFGFLVGVAFAAAWCYAVFKGKQLDRENKERAAQEEAWEREHGMEANDD
ncbi:MAG TPA: DUF4233 domain-containing protein [Enteractinococcus sp.]